MKYTGVNGEKFIIPHLKIQLRDGDIIHPRQNRRCRCKVEDGGYILLEKETYLPDDYLRPEIEWVLEGSGDGINNKIEQASDKTAAQRIYEEKEKILQALSNIQANDLASMKSRDYLETYKTLVELYNTLQ